MEERPVKSKCNCSPECDLCMCADHFASHVSFRRYGRHVKLQRASPQPSQPFRAFLEQASCVSHNLHGQPGSLLQYISCPVHLKQSGFTERL